MGMIQRGIPFECVAWKSLQSEGNILMTALVVR